MTGMPEGGPQYATELLRLPADMILEYAKMAFVEDNDNVNLLEAKGICFVCVCGSLSRTWFTPFPLLRLDSAAVLQR